MIDANTKIIVKRLPMKESDPIELEYRIDRNVIYNKNN